jgi:hypothetical protein
MNHEKSLVHLRRPTNPVPHTSDLWGPSHLLPYHPKVSPTSCLQHPTIHDSLSAYSRTLRDFKPIFDTIAVGGYGSPPQAYAAAKASEQQLEGGRKWKEVAASELGVWLGIVWYMGVHSSPAVRDYWRHNGLNPTHPICEYKGQTQFEEIKRYFHVSSPNLPKTAPTGRRLWHSKVDLILDQLRKSSQRYRMPSTPTSLDKCMIKATGRFPDTYCNTRRSTLSPNQ